MLMWFCAPFTPTKWRKRRKCLTKCTPKTAPRLPKKGKTVKNSPFTESSALKFFAKRYTYIRKIVAKRNAICTDRFNPLYIKVKGVKNLLSDECILIAYSAYLCTTASKTLASIISSFHGIRWDISIFKHKLPSNTMAEKFCCTLAANKTPRLFSTKL